MAQLINILGENEILSFPEQHSDCHLVVDGSNLLFHFSERNQAVFNPPAYERAVRNFFQHLLDAKITPHVFFDGPSRSKTQIRRMKNSKISLMILTRAFLAHYIDHT